ncbi:MAG: hypothetical protein AUH42_05925 [Gemmatimonadetes bacterium 13_1_40CM_70_11]|nr:MAG: hypothetical protein AUH42_05925 [Gemmatimonadetes bacterium 13_1_40CM_70_11]
MRATLVASVMALTLTTLAAAQRPVRIGPTFSSIALQDANGNSQSYSSFGASIDLITGDDGESGLTIARYGDLSSTTCTRQLTFIGVESAYYPIGAKGVAPFASTELGLARVTEAQAPLIFSCTASTPVQTSNQLGIAFGLGVRLGTNDVVGVLEGRFVQVPNSFVQGLEVRGTVSAAFGRPRQGELLQGTVGPAVSVLIPASGPLRGNGPLLGARFRRDTKKSGSLGLQIDYAPLKVTTTCTPPGCEPHAVLFAAGYEASVYPAWGRVYGEIGPLLAGFYEQGPDRGIAEGAQGGLGFDLLSGASLMWNANGRLLWLQRRSGENVFIVQVGFSVSPRLEHRRTTR